MSVKEKIKVVVEGFGELKVERGTLVQEVVGYFADKIKEELKFPVLAAHVENKLVTLRYPLYHDSHIKLIDLSYPDGQRVYQRSIMYLLTMAAESIYKDTVFLVLHSYRNGIYCERHDGEPITPEMLSKIDAEMKNLVRANVEIIPEEIDEETAVKIFKDVPNRGDAVELFKRLPERHRVTVYRTEGYLDYSYIPLTARTGVLDRYKLEVYPPGFVVLLPDRLDPSRISPLKKQPKLFHTFELSGRWARILGVQDAGSLNQVISSGHVSDFIKIAEALHEKRIAQFADEITKDYGRVKIVLIAGPSASGKTTFAKRLAIHLRVNELKPVALSLDNYFVDREKTPRDEFGNYDFDSIEAIDLDLLNEHLDALMQGKEIEVFKFSFKKGHRIPSGKKLQLHPDQILLIEGLHALHPKIAKNIPKENVYRIYVSALTQVSVDAHNRISTSDTRLIRRIVRDRYFRGHNTIDTLKMWNNVRKGEERFIFPYQEHADGMFNSALVYELAVLKVYAEPLLEDIGPDTPLYSDAVRLLSLLSHFLPMLPDEVPPTSILREFIGGSSLRY